jgi:hypothetical protein
MPTVRFGSQVQTLDPDHIHSKVSEAGRPRTREGQQKDRCTALRKVAVAVAEEVLAVEREPCEALELLQEAQQLNRGWDSFVNPRRGVSLPLINSHNIKPVMDQPCPQRLLHHLLPQAAVHQ